MLEECEADVELNGGEKVESEWGTDKKPASVFTIRWIKEEQKCTNENFHFKILHSLKHSAGGSISKLEAMAILQILRIFMLESSFWAHL